MHHLLPAQRELVYSIRQRPHDRQLSINISGQLRNRNFINHNVVQGVTDSDAYLRVHVLS